MGNQREHYANETTAAPAGMLRPRSAAHLERVLEQHVVELVECAGGWRRQ
jgi:hypothetical protein